MAQDDFIVEVHAQDLDDDVLGLDDDDLALLEEAEHDDSKVVTTSPAKPYQLGYISVFCIIVNKMIGTGIFDTPSDIMHDTHSVGLTLIFWLLGSIAAIAGTLVFIEYGLTIPRWEFDGVKVFTPRSGGEFNYLNYLIKKPKFFASCVYGVSFILVGNAAANALACASHCLRAAGYADVFDADAGKQLRSWVGGIAVSIMTGVCLLHGFWRRAGIAVNNVFAIIKLLMLLMIVILGFMSINGKVFGVASPVSQNLSPSQSFQNPQKNAYSYARAYLAIIFAFGGFNQANYVLGEIREPRKIFRSATLLAVGTVCVSYLLVNISYMIVVPADRQMNYSVGEDFVSRTLGQVSPYGKKHAAEILNGFMAFSSLGNVIVSTYTAARVKQEIAKEGILPFSKLIARNYDALSRLGSCFGGRVQKKALAEKGWEGIHEKTPLGALLVHWFFSLLIIFSTWGVTSSQNAYTVVFGIYSYTVDACWSIVISVGLVLLRFLTNWHRKSPTNAVVSIVAAVLFAISNLFPVVTLWFPPTKDFPTTYPWFLVPCCSIGIIVLGMVYWGFFVGVIPKLGSKRGKELLVERSPFFHTESGGGAPVQVAEVVAYNWVLRGSE